MTTDITTVTVYGTSINPTPDPNINQNGSNDAGTYEFYVEDANGEFSTVVTSTLTSIPCIAPPITNPTTTVGLTSCVTGEGEVTFNWEEGALPVTITYASSDFEFATNSVVVNTDSYTLTSLTPGQYEYTIEDANGNVTSTNFFTVPDSAAVNIRIRTASALASAMLPGGQYQTGILDINFFGPERYYNTALFDIGREVEDFGLSPSDTSGPNAVGVQSSLDYMGRSSYIMNYDDDIFAGPLLLGNSVQGGIWRYPLLIEMFIDYTENDTALQGWFEIKTKVQNVYNSQVPAGLYTLDRLLVFKDYLNYPNYNGKAWNEYVWLNDFDYQNDYNVGPSLTPQEYNIMGYVSGNYYDFTPEGSTGNYPFIDGVFLGMSLNGNQQPPTTFPTKKVDLTTFGDDPGEFCQSNTVYLGENPWKWSDQLFYNAVSNLCTAISNFSVNFQKVTVDATLPTVNPNLVNVSNCKNYYTNFAAAFADQYYYPYAFADDAAQQNTVGPFTTLWDDLTFLSINNEDGYYETFEYLVSVVENPPAYTATLNPTELNGLNWTQTGKDIFLENFNGTSVIERTFTFGSESNPIAIDGDFVGGINYSSVGLKLEWFAVYQAYEQFCCGISGEETTLNDCKSAKGLQVEVIFHPTNIPNCPTTDTPQEVKYFFRNPEIYNNTTNSLTPDLVGTQVTEYVASMKVVGGTSNRPNLFNHLQNQKIIDI